MPAGTPQTFGVQNPKKAAITNGRGERVLGISAPLRHLIPAIIQQAGDKDLNELKWRFSLVGIPSQVKTGIVDLWVIGKRVDKEAWAFWFMGSK